MTDTSPVFSAVPALFPSGKGKLLGDATLAEIVPSSIGNDAVVCAIANAAEEEIAAFVAGMPSVLLWSAISVLEEPVLTHLSAMLHVDIWDEAWTPAAKRAFLYRQVLLHRKKGTCWAVEEAVSLVYSVAQVREWFEYGGNRGCFLLDVDVLDSGLERESLRRIEMMVQKYKRKSQHLCGLRFSVGTSGVLYCGGTAMVDEIITVYQYMPSAVQVQQTRIYSAAAVDILEVYIPKEI